MYVYDDFYCARGDDASQQLRLWFSSLAYTLLQTLRRVGLKDTPLKKSTVRHDPTEVTLSNFFLKINRKRLRMCYINVTVGQF